MNGGMMAKGNRDRRLIGQILVERGLITQALLEQALSVQKADALPVQLGEVLIRLGYVSEIDIVTALVLQCNLPYIAVNKHMIDAEVLALVPPEMAHREKLVPLDRIGNILSVVMPMPPEDDLRSTIEAMTGCRIAIFISTSTEINTALDRLYPMLKES
jgi:type IV pilus assembly protein PilB